MTHLDIVRCNIQWLKGNNCKCHITKKQIDLFHIHPTLFRYSMYW